MATFPVDTPYTIGELPVITKTSSQVQPRILYFWHFQHAIDGAVTEEELPAE